MSTVEFTIWGDPQGKERARMDPRSHAVFTPEKTKTRERLIAGHAFRAMKAAGLDPFEGPVLVKLDMFYPCPSKWTKAQRAAALSETVWCIDTPDIDNTEKLCFDALNKIVYLDDRQIAKVEQQKVYSHNPRIEFTISPLESPAIFDDEPYDLNDDAEVGAPD